MPPSPTSNRCCAPGSSIVTLTTAAPWRQAREDASPTGVAAIDAALGGGLPRGQLSEIVGPRSAGRTTLLCHALAAGVERGEAVALVDPCDRFDPVSAAALGSIFGACCGCADTGDASCGLTALKAMNLVLQAGNFGLVALDLSDVPARRRCAHSRSPPGCGWRA